jgi:hypothetical protein
VVGVAAVAASDQQQHEGDLAREVRYLLSIPTEEEYRKTVEDTLRDSTPDPITVEAMRSRRLVVRTYQALKDINELINDDIRTNDRRPPSDPGKRSPDWERAAKRRQQMFGAEKNAIEPLARQVMDEQGWRPGKPNPTRRAEHRVWQLSLKGRTVTPQMREEILAEERVKAEEHARREAAQRKADRAARKLAGNRGALPQQRPQTRGR